MSQVVEQMTHESVSPQASAGCATGAASLSAGFACTPRDRRIIGSAQGTMPLEVQRGEPSTPGARQDRIRTPEDHSLLVVLNKGRVTYNRISQRSGTEIRSQFAKQSCSDLQSIAKLHIRPMYGLPGYAAAINLTPLCN